MCDMTAEQLPPVIPPLGLADRMDRSMRYARIKRDAMAARIGVTPSTVSRWTGGDMKRPPNRATLEAFADACGVSREWLIDGTGVTPTPPAFPRLVTESEIVRPIRRGKSPKGRNTVYCSKTRVEDALTSAA